MSIALQTDRQSLVEAQLEQLVTTTTEAQFLSRHAHGFLALYEDNYPLNSPHPELSYLILPAQCVIGSGADSTLTLIKPHVQPAHAHLIVHHDTLYLGALQALYIDGNALEPGQWTSLRDRTSFDLSEHGPRIMYRTAATIRRQYLPD